MFVVKYGCLLTSANKDGSDLDIEAFSDSVGGTTIVTVEEGDLLAELVPGSPTSANFWEVHEGSSWHQFIPGSVATGDLIMTWGGTIDYQNGTTFAIAPDGSVITPNLYVITDIVERAIAP